MSKIFFTLSFYHDGPSRVPQFGISTINGYSIQMKGLDLKGIRFGNGNLEDGFRHRFEYLVGGGPSVTRISLVMNTTAILPQIAWASPHPTGAPVAKGSHGPPHKRKDKYPPHRRISNSPSYRYSHQPSDRSRSSSSPSSRSRSPDNDHIYSQRYTDPPLYSRTNSPKPKRINPSYTRNRELYAQYDSNEDQDDDRGRNPGQSGDKDRSRSSSSEYATQLRAQRRQSRGRYEDELWEDYEEQRTTERQRRGYNRGETSGYSI